jgi:hypothetical protein
MKAVIAISDLHIGSTVGLCPPEVMVVDRGTYLPNVFQRAVYAYWCNFWQEFVPKAVKGSKKTVLVINGDIIDNIHHDVVNILSSSVQVQEEAAWRLLNGIRRLCPARIHEIYFVAGTEAHSGPGAQSERRLAGQMNAIPDDSGELTPFQRWLDVDGTIFHFAHTIGTTSSAAYESSAPMRELVASMVEATQWNRPMPDVLVRSHRHRFIEVPIPTATGRIRVVITPGWQLRTPFVERVDRMRMPHIGGVVFTVEKEKVCLVKEKMYPLPEPKPTVI